MKRDLILAAVKPLLEDAQNLAEKRALEKIASMKEDLEKNGWDLDKTAPYPRAWNMGRNEYIEAKGKHSFYQSFTTAVNKYAHIRSEPNIVTFDESKVEGFVQRARKTAALSFEAYVDKLTKKVGDLTKAELTGRFIWSHSILQITLVDGTVENWKTNMILNVSCLGKIFNQWPTRKVK